MEQTLLNHSVPAEEWNAFDTDPYGALEYAIGEENDFVCFDFNWDPDRRMLKMHSVVNCDSYGWIGNFEDPICMVVGESFVDIGTAVNAACYLVELALEWCGENEVNLDTDGWNQDPYYFARAVSAALRGKTTVKRFEFEKK
jgi:hypothetical protein